MNIKRKLLSVDLRWGFVLMFVFAMAINVSGEKLPYKNKNLSAQERVDDLLPRMTLEEKVLQLTATNALKFDKNDEITQQRLSEVLKGHSIGAIRVPLIRYKDVPLFCEITDKYIREHSRLGIPPIHIGICLHGQMALGTTIFPQVIGQGATWNPALIRTMAEMASSEASNSGVDQDLSPLLDLARDPRYGRVEECYGEDGYLVSQMGMAYIIGIQGDPKITKDKIEEGHLIGTAKHMAAYSIPQGGINLGPSMIGEREMRSLYLPPFEDVVKKANVYSIMPSYSEIDGIPAHANKWLLTDVLRNEWGFKGYVYSDAEGIHMLEFFQKVSNDKRTTARMALSAGVDLEHPRMYAFSQLVSMVKNNEIEESLIDQAVRRILLIKFKAGLFDRVYKAPKNLAMVVHTPEHIALARKIAEESVVLLKNDHILPLDMNSLKSIAVVGPNANQVQFGDYCVTKDNKYGVTILEGIKQSIGKKAITINYAEGCGITDLSTDGFDAAVTAVRNSDVAVVVLGGTSIVYSGIGWGDSSRKETITCGEGLDRTTLDPPGVQPQLLKALYATGKPIILVMVHGRPYSIPWEKAHLPAILDAWYPGEQGGGSRR